MSQTLSLILTVRDGSGLDISTVLRRHHRGAANGRAIDRYPGLSTRVRETLIRSEKTARDKQTDIVTWKNSLGPPGRKFVAFAPLRRGGGRGRACGLGLPNIWISCKLGKSLWALLACKLTSLAFTQVVSPCVDVEDRKNKPAVGVGMLLLEVLLRVIIWPFVVICNRGSDEATWVENIHANRQSPVMRHFSRGYSLFLRVISSFSSFTIPGLIKLPGPKTTTYIFDRRSEDV